MNRVLPRNQHLRLGSWASLLLLLLFMPRHASAVGEQNARLRGSVIEAGTDVPVPGAKVEIRSTGLVGGPRSVLTDDEGKYDFLNIPPGKYVITVIFEGIKPIRRSIILNLGETQNVKIPFSAELAATETTTIVEQRRTLDLEKASTGRVLNAEQESKLATNRRYQDVVQQTAGVSGQANPTIAGGTLRHNKYLLDGLDTTDPVTNTFSANINFDSIAQIEVLVNAADAQYNSLGGVINLITRTGSNTFFVDSSFYFNHQSLSAGSLAGTRLHEGTLLDQSPPRPPLARYFFNVNVGGPIVKDKLWFYFTTEARYQLQAVIPGAPLNTQHPSLERYDVFPRLKISWAPGSRHRIDLSVSSDPSFLYNTQFSNVVSPEAESNQFQEGGSVTLNYNWSISDHVFFTLQTGVQLQRLYIQPNSGDLIDSYHLDRASTIRFNNYSGGYTDDRRQRFQFDPTLTWVKKGWLGDHTFKAGVQFSYIRQYVDSFTPGNQTYTDSTSQAADAGVLVRDPTSTTLPPPCNPIQPNPLAGSNASPCFRTTYFEPRRVLSRGGYSIGTFLQDNWKPTSWMVIGLGLRVDYGNIKNSQDQVVQNLLGFGPRAGVSFDVTRDNRTLLKFNYSRATEVSTLLQAGSADVGAGNSTWVYNRASGRYDSFFTSAGGALGYDLRGRCNPGDPPTVECGNAQLNLHPPQSDTVTASIQRELFANVSASIQYTYRKLSYLWEDIEVSTRYTLDGSDVAQNGNSVLAFRPVKDAFRRYNGVDLILEGSPSPNWNFYVAYTLSFLEGTENDQQSSFYDYPRTNLHYFGYLDDDHRHQLKIQSNYTWRGLTLGGFLNYFTGAPTTRLYLTNVGQITRFGWGGVDPGSDPNDIRKWTELRSPDYFNLDLRVQYDLNEWIGGQHHLSFIVDLFNVFNLSTPVNVAVNQVTGLAGFNQNDGAVFGTVTNRQPPFHAQFAVRYQWGGASTAAQPRQAGGSITQ